MHASSLLALEDRLLAVERELRLLDRATPSNFWAEVERLGVPRVVAEDAPRFRYLGLPPNRALAQGELTEVEALLSRELALTGGVSARARVILELLAERTRELELECRLLGADDGGRRVLIEQRYAVDGPLLVEAHELAEAWARVEIEVTSTRAEVALASALERLSREAGLSITIEERPIAALAAVTERSLLVRSGARVSPQEAERVFSHEVTAHLLPRLRAAGAGPPYRVGTREADADEEGRAILCEERVSALGPGRRRQLALRHLAAEYVRVGRPFSEARAELTERGASEREAAEVLCRALRGGGLAREILYLPAYLRVKRAFDEAPALEREFERGRVSVAAARRLASA